MTDELKTYTCKKDLLMFSNKQKKAFKRGKQYTEVEAETWNGTRTFIDEFGYEHSVTEARFNKHFVQ